MAVHSTEPTGGAAVCSLCSAEPATPCSGCQAITYCGKECQRKDWKRHKAECKSYKVVECAEEHGRSVVAARDVKAGSVLMRVSPLVVGPRLHSPLPSPAPCLGCYKVGGQLLHCSQCDLPVCSQRCAESQTHLPECTLVSAARAAGRSPALGVAAVTPLRLLALRPPDLAAALSMEANLPVLRARPLWAHLTKQVLQPIMELELEGVSIEEVESLMGVLLTNGFEVTVKECLLFGLFFEPAMMNHSCVANTRLMLDSDHTMTVLASVPIKKNNQIKNNYGREHDPTLTRQAMMLENKFFTCRCERCLDPTELGSHTSSLRCRPPCDGAVVPEDPLAPSVWRCGRCGAERQAGEVSQLLAGVAADMEQLDKNDMRAARRLLAQHAGQLHRNHGMMIDIKQIVISGLGRMPGFQMHELKESDHKEKIVLCNEVLTLLNRVDPGLSLGRGLMLFELHSSLVMVSNLEFERDQETGRLLARLQEAQRLLVEASTILRLEAATSPYGHLALTVQQNLAELQQYIESVKAM